MTGSMTMTDDLVERWRVAAKSDRAAIFYVPAGHMRAIFNRIEALTAALTAVVDEYEIQVHGPALHSIEAANAALNTGKETK